MSGKPRILFFGSCVAEEDFSYIIENEKGQVQFAAQKVCWFFIKGVEACLATCDLLLSLRVSPYPVFRKFLAFNLKGRRRENGTNITYVPYLSLPGLRYFSTMFMALIHLLSWLWRTRSCSRRCIIVYAMYLPHILPTWLVSRLTNAKAVMIVPDLPEYMNFAPRGKLNSFLRSINVRIAHRISAGFDGLVFFSSNMSEKIDCRNLIWTVIEGCVDCDTENSNLLPSLPTKAKAIMYSGALDQVYGVGNLVKAFRQIPDPELELWLCGAGDMVPEVRMHARQDQRIKFFGMLPNQEVLAMQRRAMLLVNPRSNDLEFTRYSFPSKNLEYMSSGRPVILCRMEGIPEEYYDYVIAAEDGTVEAIRAAIVESLARSTDELDRLGERARTFVGEKKNYFVQSEKIRDLIYSIYEIDKCINGRIQT